MSMKGAGGEPLVLQFLDVSRAHPHAETLRDNFYGLPEDTCLLVRRSWYGMRDAGQALELLSVMICWITTLISPCVFAHRSKPLLHFVHGDDYVGFGVRCDLDDYRAKLHKIRILNRVIT